MDKTITNNRYTSNEHGEFACPCCGSMFKISDLKDRLSVKEAGISGMCQKCQDGVFGG